MFFIFSILDETDVLPGLMCMSSYTKTDDLLCNGWPSVSLEACVQKCQNNELPGGNCDVETPFGGCKFAVWDSIQPSLSSGSCQLADSCTLKQKSTSKIWKNKG